MLYNWNTNCEICSSGYGAAAGYPSGGIKAGKKYTPVTSTVVWVRFRYTDYKHHSFEQPPLF